MGRSSGFDWTEALRRAEATARRMRAEDPEEVAQEALLRAWRQRASCRTPDEPWAWLAQITRNEVLRAAGRPARAQPRAPEALATGARDDPAPSPFASADQRIDVRRALRRLTPEDRLIVGLRYGSDWTTIRIAQLLDMPEGTVKVRLHRARARLKETLHR